TILQATPYSLQPRIVALRPPEELLASDYPWNF
ncbi:hypothetical protein A2U01_0077738, partial [Trifolium medium]|nr:hypothetical protein [Trifolium medium]